MEHGGEHRGLRKVLVALADAVSTRSARRAAAMLDERNAAARDVLEGLSRS